MIPNDIDPSLRAGEPLLETLEDGFSPPAAASDTPAPRAADSALPPEEVLGPQSPF